MRRSERYRTMAWRGAFGIAAAIAWAVSVSLAMAGGLVADRFASNGEQVAGWYWLRDPMATQYAEFTWAAPPAGDLVLDFSVLATNRIDGATGVNARLELSVGYPGFDNMGGVFKKFKMTLQNAGGDGAGYMNHGLFTLKRAVIDEVMPVSGQLFIRVERSGRGGPHLALRADSIKIVSEGLTLGDLSGGQRTGDELQPDLGDWGDEGQCVLDRPCIGDVASGFRSTGFTGTEGWFWLRAPTVGQYADWVFEQPPAGALVLDISGLAQNIPGHVQTDTAHVLVTLGYPGSGSLGGQIGPFTVALPMIWDDRETDIWKTRALVAIPSELASSVIPVTGGLYVRVERVDEHEPDVGFSAGSVLLYPAQSIGR